jgi:hypothetical protein
MEDREAIFENDKIELTLFFRLPFSIKMKRYSETLL